MDTGGYLSSSGDASCGDVPCPLTELLAWWAPRRQGCVALVEGGGLRGL